MGKEVGYYLYIHIKQMATCHMGLLHAICRQFHVSIYAAKTVIHVKNQPTYFIIKVKCYKRDVYRLPSYMAHVL